MITGIVLITFELLRKCCHSKSNIQKQEQEDKQDYDSKVSEIQNQITEHRNTIKTHLMVIRDLKQQIDYLD